MKRLLIALVCAATCGTMLVSCKNDNPPAPTTREDISLEITLPSSGDLNFAAIGYEWAENDIVHLSLDSESHATAFKATENVTAAKAVFTATKKWPEFNKSYTLFAFRGTTTTDKTEVSVPGPVFTSAGATSGHLKSGLLAIASKQVTSPEAGKQIPAVAMEMKPVMSVMEFKIAATAPNLKVSKIVVEAANDIFPTDGKVDVKATGTDFGKITATSKSKTATLNISGNPEINTGTDYTSFYLPVAAVGASGALKVTVTAIEDYEFDIDPITFEQGKLYTETLILDPEEEIVPWDGTTVAEPQTEPGNANSYFITSGAELAWIGQNLGEHYFADATFTMTKNIDLNNVDWTPFIIGGTTPATAFKGNFNGNGYRIFNFFMNVTNTNSGLFRVFGGRMEDLTLAGKMTSTDTNAGKTHIGPLCARLDGDNAKADRGYVINCHTEIEIDFFENSNVGGLIGYVGRGGNRGVVENCTSSGTIKVGKGDYIGGIVGTTQGPNPEGADLNAMNGIYNSTSYCDITVTESAAGVGGIAGSCAIATIQRCMNEGTVGGDAEVGGVSGRITGNNGFKGRVTACVNKGAVSGTGSVGGVIGNVAALSAKTAWGILNSSYNIAAVTGGVKMGGVAGRSDGVINVSYWGGESAELDGVFEENELPLYTNTYYKFSSTSWPKSNDAGWGSDNWTSLGSAPGTWPTLKQ